MANEYLRRTPTSTGNRRVWTFSYWIKKNNLGSNVSFYTTQTSTPYLSVGEFYSTDEIQVCRNENASITEVVTKNKFRDIGSWTHILIIWDTTHIISSNRAKLFVNGVEQKDFQNSSGSSAVFPTQNYEGGVNRTVEHDIGAVVTGAYPNGYPGTFMKGEMCDIFFVDGQALTPDVFGFYKQGKGYISVGSTQSTDFRPGQWVPKTPRIIKAEIIRRGGFGVNGFYLPMNDSNNFGADFHCTPNSIIKLQENLPQPKCRIDGVGDYTGALRADPYAANLVLALPFVSGGLQNGFGDYSAAIKGSGSAKTISNGSVSIASTASYYGSSANYQNNNAYVDTPGTSGDFNMGTGDFTVEGWFNPLSTQTANARLFGQDQNASGRWDIYIDGTSASGNIYMMGGIYQLTNTGFRGGQWNHFSMVRKNLIITTYINGVAVGIVTNYTGTIGDSTNKFRVGQVGENVAGGVGYGFQGYIQDFRVYKGVAKYTGGFDVPRPYTPVGIATWRAVPDCTANNFATLNPLYRGEYNNRTLTNGNLTISPSNDDHMVATVGVTTGKWYWEILPSVISGTNNYYGIVGAGASSLRDLSYYYKSGTGNITRRIDNAVTNLQSGLTNASTNDIIGIALNASDKELSWYLNGTQLGTTVTSIASTTRGTSEYFPLVANENSVSGKVNNLNFGQNPTFSGNTTAGTFTDSNSKGLFKYQPPSGFLALCEDNLPTPAISDPGKYFKTVLWTGDGNSGRSIVGVGFTPDLVWIKRRATSPQAHALHDSVRGPTLHLESHSTNAEETNNVYGALNSFDNDGFSLSLGSGGGGDYVNFSGQTYVAWCWRAGAGTTSTNTDGSIPSVVSVNQDAGFSIVSYTGNGTAGATVGHGLGKSPAMIIIKARTATSPLGNWIVLHKGNTPISSYSNSSTFTLSGYNNVTLLNSTLAQLNYSLDAQVNGASPNNYIAYCWAEIEGFSKAFSYVGNGSADGPMIFLGLKPALIIIKRTNDAGNWQIYDSSRMSTNPNNGVLFPNLSNVEGTGSAYDIDFLSNGFKLRSTDTDRNASGSTYVGFAWAESPFSTSNSK